MGAIAVMGQITTSLLLPLLQQGIRRNLPFLKKVADAPEGALSRVGDAVVWNGKNGQQVLGGLASLSEGQERIEQVVNHIETVQLGISHTLGVIQTLSMATLGVTSLTGMYMVWRFHALDKRFAQLNGAIADVEEQIGAANRSHLEVAAANLPNSDEEEAKEEALKKARDASEHGLAIYGEMSMTECSRPEPRLNVLNYRSRCYLFGMMAHLYARVLLGEIKQAIQKVVDNKPRLTTIAETMFRLAGSVLEYHSSFVTEVSLLANDQLQQRRRPC